MDINLKNFELGEVKHNARGILWEINRFTFLKMSYGERMLMDFPAGEDDANSQV